MISEEGRERLLQVARRSIEAAVQGQSFEPQVPSEGTLAQCRGAFVTITKKGKLRGCIGRVAADRALVQVVAEMAEAAALDDYRFSPVEERELEQIRIEISVLGKPRPVKGPEEIEVGRDGLIIRRGPRAGLLLPQVASDHGWDPIRFLQETCVKAGLRKEEWREGAEVEAFDAEVWGEWKR